MPEMRLTERQCAAAVAPQGSRLELQDTYLRGLALRVTDRGSKSWVVRYRTPKGQSRFTIGPFPAVSLADAREEARKVIPAAKGGGDPAADKRKARVRARTNPIKTFNDLADAYLEACKNGEWMPKRKKKRQRTLDDETGILRRNVRSVIGKLAPNEITRAAVREVLRRLSRRGVTAQTNRTQAVIRQVFAYAIGEEIGDVLFNPARDLPLVAIEKPRTRIWSDAELKALWGALTDTETLAELYVSRPVAIALQLAALTLQRESEVAGMRRSELDLDRKTWLLPGNRTKNGHPHLVPLSDPAVELIREAMAIAGKGKEEGDVPDPIFPSPRNPAKPILGNSISHALRDLRAHLKIEGATVHDLRRTGSTAMTSERLHISPFIRSKVLGHRGDTGGGAAVSVMHYDANEYVAEKRRALDAWANLLLAIVDERSGSENVVQLVGGSRG
jgi:integrase